MLRCQGGANMQDADTEVLRIITRDECPDDFEFAQKICKD
jgi:hypothetical protein